MTQDQYAKREISTLAPYRHLRRPLEEIRWSDAVLFCNERSRAQGFEPGHDEGIFACDLDASSSRPPTAAASEYAVRAEGPGITDAYVARVSFGLPCVRRLSPRKLATVGEPPSRFRSAEE